MGDFFGWETLVLENEAMRLECLASAGPRVVRLMRRGNSPSFGENIFAEVPQEVITGPQGTMHLFGGHRLWHAPEVLARTPVPDDDGVQVVHLPDGVRLERPLETSTGLGKSITLALHPTRPEVTVTHSLTNHTLWPIELAPWAITQLRLGGTAVLPQHTAPLDADGLQPNRGLVLWPYTSWQDPRWQWGDEAIGVQGLPHPFPFKVGYFNRQRWLAYVWQDLLFVKRFGLKAYVVYPDMNCNCEVFANGLFVELESLGPLAVLPAGQTVSHSEMWGLYRFTPSQEALGVAVKTLLDEIHQGVVNDENL